MTHATIEHVMTPAPYTVGHEQPIAVAQKLMTQHTVRHLPVLEGGRLVGLVSQRDLEFIGARGGSDAQKTPVSEAMSNDVFTVKPAATVRSVAKQMAENKHGSAVVVDANGRVLGVFTTIDALRVLSALLDEVG
ncbi:MAG: CBS domain-containing protein [Myxococcaceae bacterium]